MDDEICFSRNEVRAVIGVLVAVAAVVLVLQLPAIARYLKATRM
ncbi:hypothetical protein [Saccharopolyspora taberi]